MTYSESAEGVTISRRRALQELRTHGCDDAESIDLFLAECGSHDTYNAGDVLRWLGY